MIGTITQEHIEVARQWSKDIKMIGVFQYLRNNINIR